VQALEQQRNLEHERREWTLQRICWALCAAFLGSAALGVVEPGPLTRAVVHGDQLELEYDRTAHAGAPQQITVRLGPSASPREIWLGGDWIGSIRIEDVTPQPEHITANGDRLTLEFKDAASGAHELRLRTRAERWGILHLEVGSGSGKEMSFRQLVLP
jgi:hypothetical protein